jgi:2'-5' RNA ligase
VPPTGDAVSTTDEEWEAFRRIGTFVDHWSRPGWTEHTQAYYWFLTFDGATDLHRLAERCQQELSDVPGFDPVPIPLLHMTIERAGFVDEVSEDELAAIAEAGRRGCSDLPSFDLQFGPLAGSQGAIRFSASPHEPLHQIRLAVTDAVAEVRGEAAVDRVSSFVPHVTIFYSSRETPADAVIGRVNSLRDLEHVVVPVRSLQLVRLRRERRKYLWDVVATAPLV